MFAAVLAAAVLTVTSGHPAVERARGLLDVQVTVPIVVVERVSAPGNAQTPAAWVERDRSRIFVMAWGKAYRRAQNGDAVALAAVIAHEQFHIMHGMDERPAYDEQIRVLRKLGASERDIRKIEKIAAKVLRAK